MNTKNKIPYFVENTDGFKFIGFFERGLVAEELVAEVGYVADRVYTASDLYRMVAKANEALNNIDLNHPTLKE